jgi:hypothetical protein
MANDRFAQSGRARDPLIRSSTAPISAPASIRSLRGRPADPPRIPNGEVDLAPPNEPAEQRTSWIPRVGDALVSPLEIALQLLGALLTVAPPLSDGVHRLGPGRSQLLQLLEPVSSLYDGELGAAV